MKKLILVLCLLTSKLGLSANQTSDLSPILVNQPLPFTVNIELASFALPSGLQSCASAQYGAQYLFIAGRTNGLHGFNNDDHNFPPNKQNTDVFVLDTNTNTVQVRSLLDARAGLSQAQVDTLSVTSPQYYQSGNTLYMTGGYGVDSSTGEFSTKATLTAIDIPGLINWVTNPNSALIATKYIRQITNSVFQVTGGAMYQFGQNPTLLIFGQNYTGFYTPGVNGSYTQQVRKFYIVDDGTNLDVVVQASGPIDANYRRRDLNVVPIIKTTNANKKIPAYTAFSGVFTLAGGMWTVPVEIATDGSAAMADPTLAATFKQGMNNYACPSVGVLANNGSTYTILFGGITYEYYEDGSFSSDAELPFTNQVTVVERSVTGQYQQYLLQSQYPTILSTFSNPGNTLLFGAAGVFMTAPNMPVYANGVLDLTKIKTPTVIGYIVGGIQSTVPNTTTSADSAASPYIFKVTLTPN